MTRSDNGPAAPAGIGPSNTVPKPSSHAGHQPHRQRPDAHRPSPSPQRLRQHQMQLFLRLALHRGLDPGPQRSVPASSARTGNRLPAEPGQGATPLRAAIRLHQAALSPMHKARGHEGPTDNKTFRRMTDRSVQQTAVFEHHPPGSLATFGQVFNNPAQQ